MSVIVAEHANYLAAKHEYITARDMMQSGGGSLKRKQTDIELELMKLPFYKPRHPVDNNPLMSINDAQFSMGVKLPCAIGN
jgi:hypothetical protein